MTSLREQVDTPEFKPHVTLAEAGNRMELKSMKRVADRIAGSYSPIITRVDKIAWESHPYRCLYIKIKENESLLQMRREVLWLTERGWKDTLYNPHISLLYGSLNQQEKRKLAEEIDVSERWEIELNQIAIYHVSGTPEGWKLLNQKFMVKK